MSGVTVVISWGLACAVPCWTVITMGCLGNNFRNPTCDHHIESGRSMPDNCACGRNGFMSFCLNLLTMNKQSKVNACVCMVDESELSMSRWYTMAASRLL